VTLAQQHPEWVRQLVAALPCARAPEHHYSDFGGGAYAQPRLVVRTQTAQQVLELLKIASAQHVAVATRGAGHSSAGQTMAPGGVLLSHVPDLAELSWDGDCADIPGHWPWRRVEAELRQAGRDLMVATSLPDATVGGTLSMGGFGMRSIRRGAQVDHVSALRLIRVDGRVTWCSRTDEPELFRSALTGAGQVGIVDRAKIRTASRRDYLVCTRTGHRSFRELAASITWMEDPAAEVPDYFSALAKEGRLESICATSHASLEAARAALGQRWQGMCGFEPRIIPIQEFEAEEREMPLSYWSMCRNSWCDYCFDAVGFSKFCEFVDANLAPDLGGHLAYVMCVAPPRGAPFALDMRRASETRLFSLGLFYAVPKADAGRFVAVREMHRRALEACVGLGGRPYLHGIWGGRQGLSSEKLSELYADSYLLLRRTRDGVDPGGILNPNAIN
jgi:FAD/FMN-containing dehydrogenase